ncbi:MAG: sel1 repeat family protein [Sphingomonas sp.]|uniref:tetratricopeptide repeat protein n=1 Tax=Sphingomonas sp. TaxID=28214 RepID=UPI001AD13140|nr:tetratricopeptide repeat protein [Sphingomonas sp.]MBN8816939.1 sel1 repeat family protein [Sphingomonas sp.]
MAEPLLADPAACIPNDPRERAAFLRALAEDGEAEAQALYGQLLLDGNGVTPDAKAGFAWFNRAAAQGHLMALNMVGRCYDLGWGVAVDKARAAECYRIAAEQGLDWAMYNYATLLALGQGITEDKEAALAWFRKAARMGTGLIGAKAANFVGSFHEDGWVVSRDMTKAAKYYARAAEGGDFRGCFNHARMLGDKGRTEEALSWIERAGATATLAFVEKAASFLDTSPLPAFRARGRAAIERGAAQC